MRHLFLVCRSIVGVFLVFTCLATVFHYYLLQQNRKIKNYSTSEAEIISLTRTSDLKKAVLCFSIMETVHKFLQTKSSSSSHLNCICGIRFLSMMFIIAGHSLIFMVGGPVLNTDFYDKESKKVANAIFTNSPLLVDTFLLISGFLMCYLLILELEKRKGRVNFLVLYIARYIRYFSFIF